MSRFTPASSHIRRTDERGPTKVLRIETDLSLAVINPHTGKLIWFGVSWPEIRPGKHLVVSSIPPVETSSPNCFRSATGRAFYRYPIGKDLIKGSRGDEPPPAFWLVNNQEAAVIELTHKTLLAYVFRDTDGVCYPTLYLHFTLSFELAWKGYGSLASLRPFPHIAMELPPKRSMVEAQDVVSAALRFWD